MRCAAARRRGTACASTCATSPPPTARRRRRRIRTGIRPRSGAEDLAQLERRSDLELIVATVGRLLVGTPAPEVGRVTEAIALQVVVRDLADALDAERLPRQVLAAVPPRGCARHALPLLASGRLPVGPLRPRMTVARARA